MIRRVIVENPSDSGVLVIVTGGNVCLISEGRAQTAAETLISARDADLREIILGDPKKNELTLHERAANVPLSLRVSFADLRHGDEGEGREAVDPEELDSAQIRPELWTRLAQRIFDNYAKYEGFVILHGLDTMAYTAAALSFMLSDLGKPVVLTGSQRALNYRRTDAVQNIVSAITVAGARTLGIDPVIPEVMVYAYDTVYRGNRCSMVSASSYNAFESANWPPLATLGAEIVVQTHLVRRKKDKRKPNLKKTATAKVQILDVFPGMESGIHSAG